MGLVQAGWDGERFEKGKGHDQEKGREHFRNDHTTGTRFAVTDRLRQSYPLLLPDFLAEHPKRMSSFPFVMVFDGLGLVLTWCLWILADQHGPKRGKKNWRFPAPPDSLV